MLKGSRDPGIAHRLFKTAAGHGTGPDQFPGRFYIGARTILVKSERYFDLYDRALPPFSRPGIQAPDDFELSEVARAMLEEWLKDPKGLSEFLGVDEDQLTKLSPEELLQYF